MEFNDNLPIYLQIVEKIQLDIISGHYQKGDKLPSVREFAAQYRVNPNTMQRAFSELESLALVFTERTSGRYVTHDQGVIDACKASIAKHKAKEFMAYMKKLGIEEDTLYSLMETLRKGEK